MSVAKIDKEQFWNTIDTKLLYFGSLITRRIIVKAEGVYIYTDDGQKILDFTSGQMSCLIGHGNKEVSDVISWHAKHLDHLFSGMVCPPVASLADKLINLMPSGLDRCIFLSTGGESNEFAIKLAKTFTGKFEVVGLSLSWHGMTGSASACTYEAGRAGHGPPMPGSLVLTAPYEYRSKFRYPDGSYDWKSELEYGFELIDVASCGSLAAVIIEPVLSSGGILVLPDGYMKELKKQCEKRGMLLIVDEAQTALGRQGSMFDFENSGVVPDILCLSKTIGNGLPLSVVVTSDKISDAAKERDFLFYTTHINDPIPAAVGSKVLDIVIENNYVENSRLRGEQLRAGIKKLAEKYMCIGDVRGKGLMTGIELVKDRETKESDPALAMVLTEKFMDLGLSANLLSTKSFGSVFRVAPPICITEEQINDALVIFEKGFAEMFPDA